jgi:hypothetical protein
MAQGVAHMSTAMIGIMASCISKGPCFDIPLDLVLFVPFVIVVVLLFAFLANRTRRK